MITSSGSKRYGVVLALILVIGLVPRMYHVDYPPIGYHSMKEVHYLSVSKGYLDFGDYLHKRVLYSGMSGREGYIESLPQFQLLPLMLFGLWKVFGIRIWIARLVVISFSMGCIAITCPVGRRLGLDEETSLLASFMMAVMPLSVFFGRNIQPDAAALFFLLLSTYYYLKWIDETRPGDMLLLSLSIFATAITKITFLFPVIALLFLFPFGRLTDGGFRKALLRQSLWPLLGLLMIAAWLIFTRATSVYSKDLIPRGRILLAESFTYGYWRTKLPTVWKYIGMNFTFIYAGIFALGIFWSFLNIRSRAGRYVLGSVVSAILYFLLISDFAVRHSYYHMPFLPAVCIGTAAALGGALSLLEFGSRKVFKYIALLAVVTISLPSLASGVTRHYDIMMLGCDVAGRYIKEHGSPSDRIFISYGSPSDRRYDAFRTQLYGILWEAGKRGALLPADLEDVTFGAGERRMNWIMLYNRKWLDQDREILDFIHGNYSISQIGFKDGDVLYYLMRLGGKFDTEPFGDIEKRLAREYGFSYGNVELHVKEIR